MKALLVTIGSLGDLHPFLAIGQALRQMGVDVALAVPQDHLAKTEAAGLRAHPILPSFTAICDRLGLTEPEAAVRVQRDQSFVIDEILMPSLAASTEALDRIAADADVIAASIFALSAAIVAEKRHIPHVAVTLQPMALFSAWHPPRIPGLGLLRSNPGALGRSWNRFGIGLLRQALRHRHGRAINAVRATHGLAATTAAPLVDADAGTAAIACAYSPLFGPLPPDAPNQAKATGFPFFDSESGVAETVDPRIAAYLDAGPPPLVFTLGSFAAVAPGAFYGEAATAARLLGARTILLTGERDTFRLEDDCLTLGYAPHSHLFVHAAAVVHHGGIGTTGQALRAGRPQLIVPHFSDQFDNAARIAALGVGRELSRTRFTATNAARALGALLTNADMHRRATAAGREIAHEQGARSAARLIRDTADAGPPPRHRNP